MTSFGAQLKAHVVYVENLTAKAVREVVLEVGERLLERSAIGQPEKWKTPPSDNYVPGQFKGSWDYSTGAPSQEKISTIDASGNSSRIRFRQVLVAPAFTRHFLNNNLPYAGRLEEGWAIDVEKQRMVELAIVEFPSIVKEVKLRNGLK